MAHVGLHQRGNGRRRFVPVADSVAALTATAISLEEARRWWHDIRAGGDELSGLDVPEDPWERENPTPARP